MALQKNTYIRGVFDSISDYDRLKISGLCAMYGFKYTRKFALECIDEEYFTEKPLETIVIQKIRMKKLNELDEES